MQPGRSILRIPEKIQCEHILRLYSARFVSRARTLYRVRHYNGSLGENMRIQKVKIGGSVFCRM